MSRTSATNVNRSIPTSDAGLLALLLALKLPPLPRELLPLLPPELLPPLPLELLPPLVCLPLQLKSLGKCREALLYHIEISYYFCLMQLHPQK